MFSDSFRARFASKFVAGSGCWLWTGAPNDCGYGTVHVNGRGWLAHRVSWMLGRGEIPEGMCVCHKCDVPACVRPDHLFLGTHLDNMRDMYAKNRRRAAVGTEKSQAKLTEESVIEIRRRYSRGETQTALGKEYGVSQVAISVAVLRKGWKHI